MTSGSAAGGIVYEVTERDFARRVIERSRALPVVVDFWAEWCGPCRTLGPALEQAVKAREGAVELAKVDVDSEQALAASFGIRGIPDVKAFRDGKVADGFTGALPPQSIEAFLDRLLPPTPSEADELARAGDEQSLRAALRLDPGHAEARRELGRLLLRRGDLDEARELLEPLDDDFIASGLEARALLAAGESVDGVEPVALERAFEAWDGGERAAALEELQLAVAATAQAQTRDLLRRVMVAIFTELGPDDEVAAAHRRRLAAALS